MLFFVWWQTTDMDQHSYGLAHKSIIIKKATLPAMSDLPNPNASPQNMDKERSCTDCVCKIPTKMTELRV